MFIETVLPPKMMVLPPQMTTLCGVCLTVDVLQRG
jgi:hypothetical protein